MKIYGYIATIIAILMNVVTLFDSVFGIRGIIALFILGLITSLPAIITYTSLGLNGEDFIEAKKRRGVITEKYPKLWFPIVGLILFYIVYAALLQDHRILILLSSFICSVSAYWGVYIFPKAKNILNSLNMIDSELVIKVPNLWRIFLTFIMLLAFYLTLAPLGIIFLFELLEFKMMEYLYLFTNTFWLFILLSSMIIFIINNKKIFRYVFWIFFTLVILNVSGYVISFIGMGSSSF